MKTLHFLAGLPRSGNTLLSSILNQNPLIHSSALSPISALLWQYQLANTYDENLTRLNDKQGYVNAGKKLIHNFYEHIDKPIIIDRNKAWGTPPNLQNIKNIITPNPKIIFTTRPIIEILASFINIMPNENSIIDFEIKQSEWTYKNYLTHNDNRCDFLMKPNGQIDTILSIIDSIQENAENFCLIKYDDIVNTPQKVMDKIYNFLELPNFEHDFNNIQKLEIDNDEATGSPANLHEIRPQLKKISQDPKEVLSKYIIDKYSNIGWEGL